MATKLPISVTIIAKDEVDRISYAIDSVKGWVEEVLVIDSGSEDDTVAVATKLGAHVIYNDWQGYGPQKMFAETQCSCDWILNLDADEAVSPCLKQGLQRLFEGGNQPGADAYRFPIRLMGLSQKRPSRFAPSNDPIRFYNKHKAGFKDSAVHDSVVLKESGGEVAFLKGGYYHRCFRSYTHAIAKINRYSSMQAQDIVERGKSYGAIRLVVEPFFAFFKAYFLRRYCLLGVEGFIESFIYAFARMIRLAKVRELRKAEEL